MNWKDLFYDSILERGRGYYRSGKVKKFLNNKSTNIISAEVYGSRIYSVTISHPGMPGMRMKCSCPHAKDGNNCKHMAAVLFYWQNRHKSEPADVLITKPFIPAEKGKEPFFYIADIAKKYKVMRRTLEAARKLAENNRISIKRVRLGHVHRYYAGNESDRCCMVEAVLGTERFEEYMEATLSTSDILSLNCPICNKRAGRMEYCYTDDQYVLCEHQTALLLKLDEFLKQRDPGDNTDTRGESFLRYFSRSRVKSEDEDAPSDESVVLEPRVIMEYNSFSLAFNIGNGGKMYVVKNLTELESKVQERETLQLGKACEIDFATEAFVPSSARLYELIRKEVKRAESAERRLEARYRDHSETAQLTKSIPLSGEVADTLYELYKGRQIAAKYTDITAGKNYTHLLIGEAEFKIPVSVEPLYPKTMTRVRQMGLKVTGKIPAAIEGIRGRYFIKDGIMGRIPDETWDKIRPFTEIANDYTSHFEFSIGYRNMPEFVYRILPMLREDPAFELEEPEDILNNLPPKAEYSFYLDADRDVITCKANVSYDGSSYTLRPPEAETEAADLRRDISGEARIQGILAEFFEFYDTSQERYCIANDDDVRYRLLKSGISRLMAEGEVNSTDSFLRMRIRTKPVVSFGVALKSDLLDLDIQTDDMSIEELAGLIESCRLKKKYHRLRSGEFVEISENESLEMLSELMDSLNISAKEFVKGNLHIPAYRALYLDRMFSEHESIVADRDRNFRSLVKNFKTIDDSDFEIPKELESIVRPYQKHGFKWIKTLESAGFGGILADEMGLGKTLQLLAVIQSDKNEGKDVKALVICPASLVYNWVEEVKKFTPHLAAAAVAGTKAARKAILKDFGKYDVFVTSYDLLKRDMELYEELDFSHQILDEAQYIKNAAAAAAKSVKLIHASHRFALTGTPIENRLSELWSIFDFLMPGYLYKYDQFRKSFELPISKNKDDEKTEALKNMTAPFLLRRKKTDVLKDLPEKTEEITYAVFENEQRKIYDGQIARIKKMLSVRDEDMNGKRMQILAELTRTRQICCDPSLLFEEYHGESAKLEACMDLITSAIDGGHKILLFSQFTSMLEIIEGRFRDEGIGYYKITGATAKEERLRLVNQFNTDQTPVFLISLKAGGTGLNLTGADVVIHYDPWWNIAAQNQATDRAHRIGQEKPVSVYRIIVKDTIEEKILKMQESKKELADAILSGEGKSLATMTREELLQLIG